MAPFSSRDLKLRRYGFAVYSVIGLSGIVLVLIALLGQDLDVAEFVLSLGTALIGAAVIFVLLEAFLLSDRGLDETLDAILEATDIENAVRLAPRQAMGLTDVAERIGQATDVAVCGYALDRLVDELEDVLVEAISRGTRIKILAVADSSEAGRLIRLVARNPQTTHNVARTATLVEHVRQRAGQPEGEPKLIEMRRLNWVPSCAMYMTRRAGHSGWMRVEIYPPSYNTSPGARAVFSLDEWRQPKWFEAFESQFDALWAA